MANLENYSAETTEKVQNTNSKFDFQSRNSTISAAVEAWNREHNRASQEADRLLNSIDDPQYPENERVLLSSLDPKLVEERKNAKLDDLKRWLADLLGRGDMTESTKQDIAERTSRLFWPRWTIVYNGKVFFANQLYNKIKDGTFNADWRNLDTLFSNAKVILDPYVDKSEINTPDEGIKTIYFIRFWTIIIDDKK